MDANNASTFGAGPPCFFISDKFPYAEFFNMLQIFDHTHIVFGSISFIQILQKCARKVITFKAEFCFAVSKNFAIFNFASGTGNRFVDVIDSAARTFIFIS